MSKSLLVKNARILTMSDGRAEADAMLVRDGRIEQVGLRAAEAGDVDQVFDADGRVILPGFIDGHAHLEMIAYAWGIAVDIRPPRVRSIDDLVEGLRAKAQATQAGEWILGQGVHYQDQQMVDLRYPDRRDLDRVSTVHPIVCRFSFHMNVFNSKAMEVLGLDRNTPDMEGGNIVRDASGEPTGLTNDMWDSLSGPDWPLPELCSALELAQGSYLSAGVTGLCEFTMLRGGIEALLEMHRWDALKLRVSVFPKVPAVCSLQSAVDGSMAARFAGSDPQRLRLGGMKMFLDGGLTSRAAAMHEPYHGTDIVGELAFTPEDFARHVEILDAAGHRIAVHAIGDRALDTALDAFARLPGEQPRGHRIEHAGNAFWNVGRAARFRDHHLLPVPQPPFIHTTAAGYRRNLGPIRGEHLFPFKTMVVDDGFAVPGNSDAIGIHPKQHFPMFGIWCLLNRVMNTGDVLDPDQRLDIDTALTMYTRHAARAIGREDELGSLEAGKLADFIVFDQDPRQAPIEALAEVRVAETWIGGERVYRAAA